VFCFSRAQCDKNAEALDESVDLTTGKEKGDIKQFLKKSMQRLTEADKKIGSIEVLSKLLARGIGIHHAGMLPLCKEMVEILF